MLLKVRDDACYQIPLFKHLYLHTQASVLKELRWSRGEFSVLTNGENRLPPMKPYDHLFTVMLLGDNGVGKTAMLCKYTDTEGETVHVMGY